MERKLFCVPLAELVSPGELEERLRLHCAAVVQQKQVIEVEHEFQFQRPFDSDSGRNGKLLCVVGVRPEALVEYGVEEDVLERRLVRAEVELVLAKE